MKNKYTVSLFLLELCMLLLAALVTVPFYYLIVTTFKTSQEAAAAPMALPQALYFGNYIRAWEGMNYLRVLLNNVIITGSAVLLIVILAPMAAYPLARKRSRLHTGLFLFFVAGLMIPGQSGIIALFKLIKGLGLMDNLLSVILIGAFTAIPFAIFIFHGFIQTVPRELEYASQIDGCGVMGTFWRIVYPMLMPAITTVIILNSLAIWNDFFNPLMFLQSRRNNTILLEVYRNVGQFVTDWASMFPMFVLGILPVLIFFIAMQKQVIKGVAAGAIKG